MTIMIKNLKNVFIGLTFDHEKKAINCVEFFSRFRFKGDMNRNRINYLFYGLFFIALYTLTAFHALWVHHLSPAARTSFLMVAFIQCVLEVLALIAIGRLINRFLPKAFYWVFVSLVFLWLLLHVADFLAMRMCNLSFWYALDTFIMRERFSNLVELLHQSGVAISLWIVLSIALLLLPVIGLAFYRLSDKFSKKYQLALSHKHLYSTMILFAGGMILWDVTHWGLIHAVDYQRFAKVLPWKRTLIKPERENFIFAHTLKTPQDEQRGQIALANMKPKLERNPNIYFFVVESLRGDYLTPLVAPNLSQFREEYLSATLGLSNANATHPSWFTIFHSKYPYEWVEMKNRGWQSGSFGLAMMKKLGYKIRLYTAAQLNYYDMDKLIFGPEKHLVDHYEFYPHYPPKQASQSDQEVMSAIERDLENPELREGNLFIIFLDSTHFNYSFPENMETPFTPYAESISMLTSSITRSGIEEIKNRYRNSIYFVDQMFGSFTQKLKEEKLYKDAVVFFTGDHGEEFLERGHLFHSTELNREQLSVPLYMKMGLFKGKVPIASHMNMIPTLLDYLTKGHEYRHLVQGDSLINPTQPGYVISFMNNWNRDPTEFQIHNGKQSLHARYSDDLYNSNTVEILEIRDIDGESLFYGSKQEQKAAATLLFPDALVPLFGN